MSSDEIAKLPAAERLAHFKRKAEECYARMYEDPAHNLKDWRDDACAHYAEAIRAARELGLDGEAQALEKQALHVRAVFHQLRPGDGGPAPVVAKPRSFGSAGEWLLKWGYLVVLLGALLVCLGIRFFRAR